MAALAIGSAFHPAGASAICRSERASYRLKTDPSFTARFVPALHHASVATRLYLRVTSRRRSWWFVFGSSQGYGGLFVEPVTDPTLPSAREAGPKRLGEGEEPAPMAFYPMTRALDVLASAPQPGEAAPDAFFIPEFGQRLWYDPASLSGNAGAKARSMRLGVFVRIGCAASSGTALP
jgi:hypothetical protein